MRRLFSISPTTGKFTNTGLTKTLSWYHGTEPYLSLMSKNCISSTAKNSARSGITTTSASGNLKQSSSGEERKMDSSKGARLDDKSGGQESGHVLRGGEGSGDGKRGGRGGKGGGNRNRGGKGDGGEGNREFLVSKALSWILRHGAVKEGLELDGEGFARCDQLVSLFVSSIFLFSTSSGEWVFRRLENRWVECKGIT